jgi:hypothetical protein
MSIAFINHILVLVQIVFRDRIVQEFCIKHTLSLPKQKIKRLHKFVEFINFVINNSIRVLRTSRNNPKKMQKSEKLFHQNSFSSYKAKSSMSMMGRELLWLFLLHFILESLIRIN